MCDNEPTNTFKSKISVLRTSCISSPGVLILHCWLDRSLTGHVSYLCFPHITRVSIFVSRVHFDKHHRKVQSSCIQLCTLANKMSITHFSSSTEQTLPVCQGKSSLKAAYHRFTATERRERVKKVQPPQSCARLGLYH